MKRLVQVHTFPAAVARGDACSRAAVPPVCWGVAAGSGVPRVRGALPGVAMVAPGGTRGHVDHWTVRQGLALAVAGRLADSGERLCAVCSCPWLPLARGSRRLARA